MAHPQAIALRQNRRWAWSVLCVMVILFGISLNPTKWEAVVLSVGLLAVLVWVTWPMLPDWRFDDTGVWRGRTCVAWSDVQSVDVRPYAHASRQLGSIDVVMRTPTQGILLRLYCRVEAYKVMQVFDTYLPAGCGRTPIVNAVARVWPQRRPD